MQETIIQIDSVNPVEIFGANNSNIKLLQKKFPKVKIITRGNELKILGEAENVAEFEHKFKLLVAHFNKYNTLTESNIERVLGDGGEKMMKKNDAEHGEALVFGPNGKVAKAKTANQRKLVEAVNKNDLVFAIGPAGTGKTYTAVALAVRALKNKEVKRIILTRPAVEAGEHLGFLPGDLKEKLDPYLMPLYDALRDMIHSEKLDDMVEKNIIQIAPLAFMRGRTLDSAFVILDEAQNTTEAQMKMFLTRMGLNAKFIVTGDPTQIDLPKSQRSGLKQAVKILKNIEGVEIIHLDEKDVIRHKLVKKIITEYKKEQN